MKDLTQSLTNTTPKKQNLDYGFEHASMKEKVSDNDPSDPIRSAAIFADIEYYKRGKLSGEHLDQYVELKQQQDSNGYLTRKQAIELNILLSTF